MLKTRKLTTAFGIDIYLHWSFFLLLAWVALSTLLGGAGIALAINMTVFVCLVFGCVILHELGHCLAARYYGIGTSEIKMYPIGGVARLKEMPSEPKQELVIALAGPAVNVALVALLAPLALLLGQSLDPVFAYASPALPPKLVYANATLAIFNMIPAFPMDGGRVLRAVLAFKGDYVWATNIASRLGQCVAGLFALVAFTPIGTPMLLLIAVFIFFAASAERRIVANNPSFLRKTVNPGFVSGGPTTAIPEDNWELLPPTVKPRDSPTLASVNHLSGNGHPLPQGNPIGTRAATPANPLNFPGFSLGLRPRSFLPMNGKPLVIFEKSLQV